MPRLWGYDRTGYEHTFIFVIISIFCPPEWVCAFVCVYTDGVNLCQGSSLPSGSSDLADHSFALPVNDQRDVRASSLSLVMLSEFAWLRLILQVLYCIII